MIGSRPVVGSSKKMISGSAAIARASATRFCMPPDNSAGRNSPDLRRRARPRRAFRARSPLPPTAPCRVPGSTRTRHSPIPAASRTEHRLETSMPIFCSMRSRARRDNATVSAPSIATEPRSGCSNPRMHLISTDLPTPEPPITTRLSPGADLEVDAVEHEIVAKGLVQSAHADFRSARAVRSAHCANNAWVMP